MRSSNLCTDIGYHSLNKYGEQLCGDHVDVVEADDGSQVIVLADGLGSGVKASILSTLTAKIISTMMSAGLRLEDCVETIIKTLPVCKVRGLAYSTFTIVVIKKNQEAEVIQYDNPEVILLRDGKGIDIPKNIIQISNKTIMSSKITLKENDYFILMSDGV